MSRNMQIVITDNKGQERATYRITYGARLRVDEGATVKRGDRLAEWNPNALPVLTDVEGIVKYEDLVFGVTVREVADEKTGVSSKVVMDSRGTGSKNAPELRPAVVILAKNGKPVQLPGGGEARYAISPTPFCRWKTGPPSGPVTYWRVSRPKAPRPAISPAVCRGWRNCSKPASPRKRPCWPRPTVLSSSARTTRTSAASS